MPSQATVEIELDGHDAFIAAEFASLISQLLEQAVRRWLAGGPLGFRQERCVIPYYKIANDQVSFRAGLAPRIQQHLQERGYSVRVNDRTCWGHLRRANMQLRDVLVQNAAPRDALAALSKSPRGQLHVADLDEVPYTVALMCRLFAYENIMVIALNSARANWLATEIGRIADRPVDRDFSVAKHRRPRVLVVTGQLAATLGGDDFGIVICADIESALHESNDPVPYPSGHDDRPDYRIPLVVRWRNSAVYLVSDAHRVPTASEEFRLDAIFGPVIFSVFGNEPRRDVVVVFVPSTLALERDRDLIGLDRKRHLYWHNQAWNEQITAVAQQAATGALSIDPRHGIEVASMPSVSVLVESSEHGRVLKNSLPSWPVMTVDEPVTAPHAQPHGNIVTFSHAAEHGLNADVVIRADGGADWPLRGVIERAEALVTSRLVVDFEDRRNTRCTQDTDSRMGAYQRHGWMILPSMSSCRELVHSCASNP